MKYIKNIMKCFTMFNLENWQYLPHYWSDEGLKGTAVYRPLPSLHGGSFKFMYIVPLMVIIIITTFSVFD